MARLTVLWADLTIKTPEIGRRLRTTKDAVIGKAHRLKLPLRGEPCGPRIKKAAPEADVVGPPVERVTPRRTCKWPIGQLMSDTFRFCGKEAEQGSLYCADHIAQSKRRY